MSGTKTGQQMELQCLSALLSSDTRVEDVFTPQGTNLAAGQSNQIKKKKKTLITFPSYLITHI